MEQLPQIIVDLAYILIIAGVVTILFKKLRQPLVLGYIVAGFLAGPHMPYTPSIDDHGSINEWSQIGVIFLMFTLGLEFSFKKIVKMGLKPIIAALCVMTCMISLGSLVASVFHWNSMDRLFLGGMLAMSSTTIIYKAFDDLGLRTRKFASGVLSVLIIEDILGILLMVVLSALAVSRQLQGAELIESMFQLGFFLLLWFLVGVYLVPLILRRYKQFINTETLLIVSVGLCFLLVVIASHVGYSPAFGAFMMGSILAETVEAERIERIVAPLRDLFGAIFFVSVGMLVAPHTLIESWFPILVITLVVLVGQMLFGSLSFLVAGNSLKDSIQSGFSMAQIGEFAFIIAALGQTLGVTSKFLYPVVVAVSIITTFFTPYMIKASVSAYSFFNKVMPNRISLALEKRKSIQNGFLSVNNLHTLQTAWKGFLLSVIIQTAAYLTLCIAIISVSFGSLLPLCRHAFGQTEGNILCGVFTFLLLSPCIRPIVIRKNRTYFTVLIRRSGKLQRFLYSVVIAFKFYIGCNIVYYLLDFLSPLQWYWHFLISIFLVILICVVKRIKLISIKMERTFRQNLGSREAQSNEKNPIYARKLKGKDLHIVSLTLPINSAWGGHTLAQLHIGHTDNVHVVAIVRGNQRINIPGGAHKLFPADVIEIVGDDDSIQAFSERMQMELLKPQTNTLLHDRLILSSFNISKTSPLSGNTLMDINLRQTHHCMVVGIEDSNGNLQSSSAQKIFKPGEKVWIVGKQEDVAALTTL